MAQNENIKEIETVHILEFPYTRTTGPVVGDFLTSLRDGKILGSKIDGKVYCPPLEFHPETYASIEKDMVEVGPSGTLLNWTWVNHPTSKHPIDKPFAFGTILLDGADSPILHGVATDNESDISQGMRVSAVWKSERAGSITDIYFMAEDKAEKAQPKDIKPGEEPVAIMEHLISVEVREKLHPHKQRFLDGLMDGKIIGQKSPVSGKVYIPSRGYDNLERVLMGENCDVEVSDVGTVVGFTELTPVQYHGQEETEPYIRCSILLDGADQPLVGIDIRNIPTKDFRTGMRLKAVWKPEAEREIPDDLDNRFGSMPESIVERWESTGEPDVDYEEFKNQTW